MEQLMAALSSLGGSAGASGDGASADGQGGISKLLQALMQGQGQEQQQPQQQPQMSNLQAAMLAGRR